MVKFDRDIFFLKESIKQGLPGHRLQQKLAPRQRPDSTLDYLQRFPDFKTACVLLLLYPLADETTLVLIERSESGNHGGQIGLPGGKKELDETHVKTAIRETYEEIGVSLRETDIISPLTEIYIPPSNFLVHPFVGVIMEKPAFIINKSEVKRIIEIPLHAFKENDVIKEKIFSNSSGFSIKAPYYDLAGIAVWGATAMILSEFTGMMFPEK